MKKIFFSGLLLNLAFICSAIAAEGDYCVTRSGYCYWCNAKGPSSGSYCDRGYAG